MSAEKAKTVPYSSFDVVSAGNAPGRTVHYEVETSSGGTGVVVYEVHEVYVYIPAELSAAGFELKLGGVVRITDRDKEFYINWKPNDLSHEDVASLYSAEADGWAVVDEIVEPPEMIDSHELKYPDREYRLSNLEAPEPILSSQATSTHPHVAIKDGGVQFRSDGDAQVTGIVSTATPARQTSKDHPRADTVNFPISKIHSIKESTISKKSLTFFLTDGRELPTLHFHDGGTAGLLQAMQRYTYLIRDPSKPSFYRASTFKKTSKEKPTPIDKSTTPTQTKPTTKPVEHLFHEAVSGFVGITRAVRQHLLPDKNLLDVRPGTENDDLEETIQTVAVSDIKSGSQPTSPQSKDPTKAGAGKTPSADDPEASLIGDFQIITDIKGKLPVRPAIHPRQPPVSVNEWECLRDDWGRISPENEMRFRGRVMYGGIEEKLRKEAWKYLLGYMPFQDSDIERMELREKREQDYWRMKRQWEAFTPEQEKRFAKWREFKQLISKDVLRTDRELDMYNDVASSKLAQLEHILRTYVMYNFDLGYVQGMSDLLAPLLSIMDNEVDTFWCFAGLMEIVGHHFELSQAGMRQRLKQLRALLNITDSDFYGFLKEKESHNLYFCFRWLLVNFKREFSYEDIYKIWEVTWTNYISTDFSLFIALAILQREKRHLENDKHDFSDILQHINCLSKHLPVNSILESAESLCRQMGSCKDLPEDLQPLLVQPLPPRPVPGAEAVRQTTDTIVCDPNMRAVPSH